MKVIGLISDYSKDNESKENKRPFYRIRENYVERLEEHIDEQTIIVMLPYLNDKIDYYTKICDGVLLVGGDDIPPDMYGEKSTLEESMLSRKRSVFEVEFIKKYITTNKPLLGICAGMQAINVALGGTLHQDISNIITDLHNQKINFTKPVHCVYIRQNTKFFDLFGVERLNTNSMHHQAVKNLGKDIVISATSKDNIVEAIEVKNHNFCFGVQWHPEFLSSEIDNMIFKNFCCSI